ncbi:WD40-repeat-containing domain protein [Suillus tomentosus]|nr:WD40-repeat-containing domain protein [Suillus tomentosus]
MDGAYRISAIRLLESRWSKSVKRIWRWDRKAMGRRKRRDNRLILEPIETGHTVVWAVVYSPDMSMIATGGHDGPRTREPTESSIKIWDTKTGELVATLKGHTDIVGCLTWTKDGKTLISGSDDNSIRTWNTKTWKQTALLEADTDLVFAIAISPNDRILANAWYNQTVLLWNLDNGQPIGPPIQHASSVDSLSFSQDGKLLATGCFDKNAYTWDVAAIVKEAGLDDLLSEPKANKLAVHASAAPPPAQRRPPAYRIPQGFFDGSPPNRSHSSARRSAASSVSPGSKLLGRLFHRNRSPSSARATPLSSPLDWTRNILKQRRQRGEGIAFQGPDPAVVEVPCAPGTRRNACAREKRKNLFTPKIPTTAAISGSSSTPPVGDATGIATISTTSRPDATIKQAGLWTRFWLFLGCLSPEYTDGHH